MSIMESMAAPELANQPGVDAGSGLLELQRELSRCTDLSQLRAVLANELGSLMRVKDRVSIALLEPDGEWLRVHRILPVVDATSGALPRVRVEGTPVGQVAREGIARIVGDVRTDPNITFGHASHDGIRSTVSVPLRIDGRVVGAMNAGSRTVGVCDAEALARLEAIAAIVGPIFYAVEQGLVAPPVRARQTELIGASAQFRSLIAAAQRTAHSDADVLITGETGVGKTALARALHAWSTRASAPFVTVHLNDLSATVVESELFGYERGAFTGASTARIGRFESARGGTIFLDEIGEAPLAIQTKLLRIIQDRCFERVGGVRTIDADVRIIAATSRDLREATRRGEFREDLYYRLSVVPLHVPPLRDRGDDLELLVTSILARVQGPTRRRSLSAAAWEKLRRYRWPGNIRELESVLRRAVILEEGTELELSDFAAEGKLPAAIAAPPAPSLGERLLTLDEHERAYIEHVLEARRGVIEGANGAARTLGVPPSTLRSKMKRLGISLQGRKGRTP